MTEPNNAVLQEQIKQMRKDFQDFKTSTREDIRQLERDMESNNRTTNELNITMSYVKETVSEMKDMMKGFIGVQNTQNEKIDDFVNSDKRASHKKDFVVSVLQVVSGIIIALIGMWGAGQL